MRLTAPDEYFLHQTPFPHELVASSDPNWRERYWVSVQDSRRDDFILSFGFGKYPNRDVMEGFVICSQANRQWNLRASGQLSGKSSPFNVIEAGPLRAEIVEPLRTLRFRLNENPSGLVFDLLWQAAMPAMLEERHFEVNRTRVTHDLSRYVQLGRVEGRIKHPLASFSLPRESGWSERDHSWGLRPMAGVKGDPPVASAEWNFLAFCPIQFETFCLHVYLFESQRGRLTHLTASVARAFGRDEAPLRVRGVEHDLEWDETAPVRTLKRGRLKLHIIDGEPLDVEIEARPARVYLLGGGYGVDQGHWKGEVSLEHDAWDLGDAIKPKDYARSSSDHRIDARCNGERGMGVIEYIVRRGHEAYGRRSGA